MFSLTPCFSRTNQVVFILSIVCVVTILAGMVFVAARNNNGELSAPPLTSSDPSTKVRIADRFGQLSLSFEVNKGQTNEAVKFLSHGPGYDLFLLQTKLFFVYESRWPRNPGHPVPSYARVQCCV